MAKVSPSEFENIKLLALESNPMMLYGDGISTINFFKGDGEKAAEFMKRRLAEVGEINPWIGSSLVKDPVKYGKLIAMRCRKDFPTDEVFELNTSLSIHETMPFADICKEVATSSAHVPSGYTLIETGKPVCKLTIIAGDGTFVIIFSMSHVVADGFTYYAILNMLSETAKPYPMIAVRNESLRDGLPAAVGEKEYKSMTAPGASAIMNYIGAYMRSKNRPPYCFFIDDEKLKAVKESASQEDGAAPWVSSNDILTAGFARAVKGKMITMAMDFRGRLEGLTLKHAGCYHLGVLFGQDFHTANDIRNALNGPQPYSRGKLPGTCMSGNWTPIISNWSSMSKGDLLIPGCEQTLHLPYVMAEPIDCCVVFKARPGKVAVMMFVQNGTIDDLRRELPLGEVVSADIFPAKPKK